MGHCESPRARRPGVGGVSLAVTGSGVTLTEGGGGGSREEQPLRERATSPKTAAQGEKGLLSPDQKEENRLKFFFGRKEGGNLDRIEQGPSILIGVSREGIEKKGF